MLNSGTMGKKDMREGGQQQANKSELIFISANLAKETVQLILASDTQTLFPSIFYVFPTIVAIPCMGWFFLSTLNWARLFAMGPLFGSCGPSPAPPRP